MKKLFLIALLIPLVLVLAAFRIVNKSAVKESEMDFSKLTDYSLVYPYTQLPLPYAYDALEPYIDKTTMEIHYSKHHKAYTDKFNEAIKGSGLEKMKLLDIFKNVSKYPAAVRNFGGGFYNHQMFWQIMGPASAGKADGKLAEAISKDFGGFEQFKGLFSESAKTLFGSGWVWLSLDENGKLFVSTTANQDNPLMDVASKKGIPVLCLDVWEHAYYLKYQNRRADYINSFWSVVNWKEVGRKYDDALKALAQ